MLGGELAVPPGGGNAKSPKLRVIRFFHTVKANVHQIRYVYGTEAGACAGEDSRPRPFGEPSQGGLADAFIQSDLHRLMLTFTH